MKRNSKKSDMSVLRLTAWEKSQDVKNRNININIAKGSVTFAKLLHGATFYIYLTFNRFQIL